MSRKRCKRRVYALVNPIQYAIAGAAITSDADLNKLQAREVVALEAFRDGQAQIADWRLLADVLNIAETMARAGIGPEVLQTCERAESVLLQTQQRHRPGEPLTVDAEGLAALYDLAADHHLQRTSVARSVYEQAIAKTSNRVRSAAPGVKVLA